MTANIAKISTISIGTKPNFIIADLLKLDIHINLLIYNLLDYTLPPKNENSNSHNYHHELRFILKQLGAGEYVKISESLSLLLKENDRMNLGSTDLAISAHISQIEQNSKSLSNSYEILLKETKVDNVNITPLVSTNPNLLVFKGKKYAPLRYFAESGDLLSEEPPESDKKRKQSDKKHYIENLDALKTLKFSEDVEQIMEDSDLVIILASDYTSLGTLVQSKEIKNQMLKTSTPLVFIWTLTDEVEPHEKILAETIGYGSSLIDFSKELSELTDYVILDKANINEVDALRNHGCKVFVEDLWTSEGSISEKGLNAILSVGGINRDPKDVTKNNVKEIIESNVSVKPLSQLIETSDETDNSKEELVIDKEESTNQVIEDVEIPNEEEKEDIEAFEILEEEEWFDSVKRAIDLAFESNYQPAIDWLLQSGQDSEKEEQIAENLIKIWIESRSITQRKRGAELIAIFVNHHSVIYQQILQKHMIISVTERADDIRRQLILLYHILYEENNIFSEKLIGGIVRELASLDETHNHIVFETSKITILQLVITKKKLTVHAIDELLSVLDTKQGSNAELWNVLTAFEASTVAIELVTRFSINKLDEITRKSSILRFTGSFYSIISKVIKAWKDGDKVVLSNVIGSILPEATMRKFERMELARSVEKLRMVQLSTLADTLGKDIKNVETLVTELIVNGELKAEFKLIEDKMYLVALEGA